MNEIKINHQDGLIYFDKLRLAELILLKSEDEENEYLLIIDIQTYDYSHSKSELKNLEKQLQCKINNQFDYVWITFEEFCELSTPDELDGLAFDETDSEDKFLYFGWHIPLFNNRLKFSRKNGKVDINWKATSEDVNYYDQRAKANEIEINCSLDLFIFTDKDQYQKHEKLKSQRTEAYFEILRSLPSDKKNFEEIEKAWTQAIDKG